MIGYDSSVSEYASVELEAALHYAAVAARAWSERRGGSDKLVHELMRGASWANRVRAADRRPPLTLEHFLRALEQSLDEWLHATATGRLLEDEVPTLLCGELLEDPANPESEAEQRAMVHVMRTFEARPDGASHYTRFRRFVIEHSWAHGHDILELTSGAGLHADQVYERIGSECVIARSGTDSFAPCPVCRWPMRVWDRRVCCISDQCRSLGARFDRDVAGGELRGMGPLSPPELVPLEGHRRLRYGLWRYTVLPGLVELELYSTLERLPGVSVELWPNLDRYDLDVRCVSRRWMVDVKDHASVYGLARRLRERPPTFDLVIVVPDHRGQQVPTLRRLFLDTASYSFQTCEDFIRGVERAGL